MPCLGCHFEKRGPFVFQHAAGAAGDCLANPLLGQGIIPGQHTYDRTRETVDADLDLLPGRSVTPFIGFSLHRSSGPGTTTYTLGGDEFRLSQDSPTASRSSGSEQAST